MNNIISGRNKFLKLNTTHEISCLNYICRKKTIFNKGHVVQFLNIFFIRIWICSTCLLVKFFMSLYEMVTHLFSAIHLFTPENYISLFCWTFSKRTSALSARYRDANKQNAACNLHRLSKIHFQFYFEEETSPQSFFSYLEFRLGHVQIVVCQPPKQRK